MEGRIKIHHLSDLHFGKFRRKTDDIEERLQDEQISSIAYDEQYFSYLRGLKSDVDELPGLIVITGDLTSICVLDWGRPTVNS